MVTVARGSVLLALLAGCGRSDVTVGVSNDAPEVLLVSPSPGAVFAEGQRVAFRAEIRDDDDLDALRFLWSSSLDGPLDVASVLPGDGSVVMETVLSPGAHRVTLRAADPLAESGEASVDLTVAADAPPTVAFSAPVDGGVFELGTPIPVEVAATDDGPPESLSVRWFGSVPSLDAETLPSSLSTAGTAIFALPEVPVGAWSLVVSVTDSRGQNTQAEVAFSVFDADLDGDGFRDAAVGGDDCDDRDADVFPGADEVCNGLDDDCDTLIDEAAVDAPVWYDDADEDGFGSAEVPIESCTRPDGHVTDATDCDDSDDAVNPTALEVCNGVDDDCDSTVDSDAVDRLAWYADADGDGFGDAADLLLTCASSAPERVRNADDCDDGPVTGAAVHPDAVEVCNAVDDDCDGDVDTTATDRPTWFADFDGDGFGDVAVDFVVCDAPADTVANSSDCDDGDAAVRPGASEVCNHRDDDCDSAVDEASIDAPVWYADSDGDGFGDASVAVASCAAPANYVADDADCNDFDDAVNPIATEVCNGIDDDCDTAVDSDAVDRLAWYADADGDSFGNAAERLLSCAMSEPGRVANPHDCDDTPVSGAPIHPGATEVCNAVDDDCDGDVDATAVDRPTWYLDFDGDGFGDRWLDFLACEAPDDAVSNAADCDDDALAVNPDADESCNGIDDDCDEVIDVDAVDRLVWYRDADADDFGDALHTTLACAAPTGFVADDSDCADADANRNPGEAEVCNRRDDNCDLGDGDGCAVCDDLADNDGDGRTDAEDPGCLSPTDPTESSGPVLASGYNASFTCALLDDGRVKCWGANASGQLGVGDALARGDAPGEMGQSLPAVDFGTNPATSAPYVAVAVGVGAAHACAILDDGGVRCWGNGASGRLGHGDVTVIGDAPGEIAGLTPVDLGAGRTAVALALGDTHTCALRDDGRVKCWGSNDFGALGLGIVDGTVIGDVPGEVGSAGVVDLGSAAGVPLRATAISAGLNVTCAVLETGAVKCWGRDTWAALGRGLPDAIIGDSAAEMGNALAAVNLGTGERAISVATTGQHTCALLDDGAMKCWGYNLNGQLGRGMAYPSGASEERIGDAAAEMGDSLPIVAMPGGLGVLDIVASSGQSTCALLDDHGVYCWGINTRGQLGRGDMTARYAVPATPSDLGPGRLAQGLAVGLEHVCAVRDDDRVVCWGRNQLGQVGFGAVSGNRSTAQPRDVALWGNEAGEMGAFLPAVLLEGYECADGVDQEWDGLTDLSDAASCTSATDNTER